MQAQQKSAPVPSLQLPSLHNGTGRSSAAATGTLGSASLASSAAVTAHTYALPTASSAHSATLADSPSQILAAHTNSMGIFSTYKSQAQIKDSLKLSAAQRHVDQLADHFASLQTEVDVLKQQFDQESHVKSQMSSELAHLEYEREHVIGNIPNMLERRTKSYAISEAISGLKEKLKVQEGIYARTKQRFEAKDLEKDSYQYELQQLDELRALLKTKREEESFQLGLLAQASESHNLKLQQKAARQAARNEAQIREEEAIQAAKDLADHLKAEEFRAKHSVELARIHQQIQERENRLHEMRKEAIAKRRVNVLELKTSTEKAQNELMAANAARTKALERREKARAHERKELEGAGRNADAIFAARDEEKRMANKAKRIAAEQAVRASRLQAQIKVEDEIEKQNKLQVMRDAVVQEDYNRAMGRSVIDTKAFAMERARAAREAKLRNEEALLVRQLENAKFVPEDATEASDDDWEQEQPNNDGFQSTSSGIPNLLLQQQQSAAAAAAAAALGNTGAALGPPAEDSSDDEFSTGGPAPDEAQLLSPSQIKQAYKYENRIPGAEYNEWGLRIIPNHSNPYRANLDARKVALALQAQREKLARGTPKVVCGKSYDHTSKFLSDPPKIIFKDFTVGEEMSQVITITNVSFSFNHFKILPLKDEYLDFFDIIYTPVGRMSAGSIAKIKIVFKPKVNQDILTVLPLLAETGPFSIPLECYTKKAKISIKPYPLLDMGVTVLGDSSSASFTIVNDGAIPVDFIIEPVVKPRPPELLQQQQALIFERTAAPGDSNEEKEPVQSADDSRVALGASFGNRTTTIRPQTQPASLPSDVKPLNFTGLGVSPSKGTIEIDASVHAVDDEADTFALVDPSKIVYPNDAALADPSQISLPPDFHRSEEELNRVAQANAAQLAYSMDYLSFERGGRVEAYSSTKWSLTFTPKIDGSWVHSFVIRFGPQVYARNQKPVIWDSEKDFELEVTGEGVKVPIYIENDLLEFQTMCFGKLYRSEIVLHNRHNVAHKLHMLFPPRLQALSEFIEFTPKVGYIQGLDSLKIQVKIRPQVEMWRLLKKITLASSRGCINEAQYDIGHVYLPLSIDVTDQTLPVLWSLTARLVEPKLKLSATSLDFGHVFTSESKMLPIMITNQSPLQQKLSFVHLKPEIKVEPYEGLITIPPFRSMEVNIVFSPSSSIDYAFDIELVSKLGEQTFIPIRGVGRKPRIHLQHTQIQFQATPNENASYQTNLITNLSTQWKHKVEFIVDEPVESEEVANSLHSQKSFLNIFPRTIQLDPLSKESTQQSSGMTGRASPTPINKKAKKNTSQARVELEFKPFLNVDELYANIGLQNDVDEAALLEEQQAAEAASAAAVAAAAIASESKSTDSPSTSNKKKGGSDASSGKQVRKKKLTAAEEAELAKQQAAEEELRRLEQERLDALAAKAAAAAARKASAEFELECRDRLEAAERILTKNDRPEQHWAEFSDRLQLRITEKQNELAESKAKSKLLAEEKEKYDDEENDELDEVDEGDESDNEYEESAPAVRRTIVEPFSRHIRHRIAVHIESEHVTTREIQRSLMFMEVKTTLVLPMLTAKPHVIDFGQMPLGKSCTKSFEVRNTSQSHSIQLMMDTLGYATNFRVLNALRLLQPGEIQIIVVEFKPRREGKQFKQDLVLRSQQNPNIQVTIPLVGLCISPNLQIVLPPSTTNSENNIGPETKNWPATNTTLQMQQLHLGDCVVNESLTRTFTVKNLGIYPYAFTLSQHSVLDGAGAQSEVHGASSTITTTTHNIGAGAPVEFYFVPSQGIIPAQGGSVTITVHFTPTTPTLFFPYQTIVEVGNQRLKLVAEVHERQLFVLGGRQVPINDTQASLPAPALQQQVEQATFQTKSLVSGVTHIGNELIYQHPLAFLDGASTVSHSVGGGLLATNYPLLLSDDPWDRVNVEDVSFNPVRVGGTENEKGKKGAKSSTTSSSTKKSDSNNAGDRTPSGSGRRRTSESFEGSSGGNGVGSTFLSPTAISNRQVEITFDANRPIELSRVLNTNAPASSASKTKSSRDKSHAIDPNAPPPMVLVETMQLGSALLGGAAEVATTGGKNSEKDGGGSFEITFHSVRAADHAATAGGEQPVKESKEKRASSAGGSSSSQTAGSATTTFASSLDPESILQLFSVEPSNGSLKAGAKDNLNFLFDMTKYHALKSNDAERRVLNVGQWLEAQAKITFKGGAAQTHLPPTQTIDVRLKVYVD